jgi:ornithine cyclodeaminase/alanine dehydrogenase-like protein (mu-crystallin family)
MRILTHEDIRDIGVSPAECVQWVEKSFSLKEKSKLPHKTSISMAGNIFFNTMPCIIPSLKSAGAKLVTRFPERTPAIDGQILLYSSETGELEFLMDAAWITAARTGAVAASAIRTFATPSFTNVSFVGLGNTARATMECFLSIYPEREVTIRLLKYKNQAELFVNRFSEASNLKFKVVDSITSLIEGADVVVSCVTAADTLFADDSAFSEGVLVVPLHTRGFQNCDLVFDKVFADDESHVSGFKNFNKFRKFAEYSSVLNGSVPGRETKKERILSYNIGLAIHDIFFARKIASLVRCQGQEVHLRAPVEKFWF